MNDCGLRIWDCGLVVLRGMNERRRIQIKNQAFRPAGHSLGRSVANKPHYQCDWASVDEVRYIRWSELPCSVSKSVTGRDVCQTRDRRRGSRRVDLLDGNAG